ncbi:MAG: ribosome maturation factor RimM [Spirochaetia bacterium]|nr:ribosome maturation factor RimM [Spirochaetia bacterium]
MSENKNLAIGKVRTSFGVKGHVKIVNFSGESRHFLDLEEISLKYRERSVKKIIEDVSLHGSDVIIKFRGIDTPEDAKKFIDWEIWVPREKACPLYEGEYYLSDLYGCTLVSEKTGENSAKVYGKVISVLSESGADDFLEIESSELDEKDRKKIFLVPFKSEFLGNVDIDAGTIELLTEWIIP